MTWEPRPLPEVTPDSERFWSATTDETFLLGECADCGLCYYYPRPRCPDCLSDDVDWTAAEGTGEVYSYSVAERVAGWPEAALPLIVAYVELTEGPRLVTNIVDCVPESVQVGTPVELAFVSTQTDLQIPAFTVRS